MNLIFVLMSSSFIFYMTGNISWGSGGPDSELHPAMSYSHNIENIANIFMVILPALN